MGRPEKNMNIFGNPALTVERTPKTALELALSRGVEKNPKTLNRRAQSKRSSASAVGALDAKDGRDAYNNLGRSEAVTDYFYSVPLKNKGNQVGFARKRDAQISLS